ncbi:MAG: GtrA family protein [Ruminococcaceae bacterium]|nr:GtrA family protein [Oscillospiraceae bacterium]
MKKLFEKYREIIMYLIFGVLTTVVGFGTYFLIMAGAEHLMGLPMDNETSGTYIAVYMVAQVVQWVAAVLFAFFTNRKWVFTDADKSEGSFMRQLVLFAGSRVASFLLDLAVTYGCTLLLALWITTPPVILGIAFTPGVIAKLVAAVLVIIANYVLSKLIVFTKKKD